MELINKEAGEYDITDEVSASLSDGVAEELEALASKWDQAESSGGKPVGEWWKAPRAVVLNGWPYR
jgi:hypothetical protein